MCGDVQEGLVSSIYPSDRQPRSISLSKHGSAKEFIGCGSQYRVLYLDRSRLISTLCCGHCTAFLCCVGSPSVARDCFSLDVDQYLSIPSRFFRTVEQINECFLQFFLLRKVKKLLHGVVKASSMALWWYLNAMHHSHFRRNHRKYHRRRAGFYCITTTRHPQHWQPEFIANHENLCNVFKVHYNTRFFDHNIRLYIEHANIIIRP